MKVDTKEIGIIKASVTKSVNSVLTLEIKNDEDLELAVKASNTIALAAKEVEAKKRKILDPLAEVEKEVRSLFKPIEDQIKEAKLSVEGKVLAYRRQVREEADRKAAEIAKKEAEGKISMPTAAKQQAAIVQNTAKVETSKGKATFRKVRKAYIVDAGKVPDQYWKLDEVAVRKDALAGIVIPGVEVREEEEMVNRV